MKFLTQSKQIEKTSAATQLASIQRNLTTNQNEVYALARLDTSVQPGTERQEIAKQVLKVCDMLGLAKANQPTTDAIHGIIDWYLLTWPKLGPKELYKAFELVWAGVIEADITHYGRFSINMAVEAMEAYQKYRWQVLHDAAKYEKAAAKYSELMEVQHRSLVGTADALKSLLGEYWQSFNADGGANIYGKIWDPKSFLYYYHDAFGVPWSDIDFRFLVDKHTAELKAIEDKQNGDYRKNIPGFFDPIDVAGKAEKHARIDLLKMLLTQLTPAGRELNDALDALFAIAWPIDIMAFKQTLNSPIYHNYQKTITANEKSN